MKALTLALAASLALSLTSLADAKQSKKKHKQAKAAPVTEPWRANGSSQQPARMIQVNGRWISSYECMQDGGYGRIMPCDFSDTTD